MSTTTLPLLTVEFINANIGKEISWIAEGYSGNGRYQGTCKLLGLQAGKDINSATDEPYVRPVIEQVAGDELDFGWVEGNYITYTDSGRPVYITSI